MEGVHDITRKGKQDTRKGARGRIKKPNTNERKDKAD